jgi:hypothetical protein
MSISELLDKEAENYKRNLRKKSLASKSSYNNYSYGSKEISNYSMENIFDAYKEYKENVAW